MLRFPPCPPAASLGSWQGAAGFVCALGLTRDLVEVQRGVISFWPRDKPVQKVAMAISTARVSGLPPWCSFEAVRGAQLSRD